MSGRDVIVSEVVTPADWQRRGMAAGTPFGPSHHFGQTGPFRPRNLAPNVGGVVFVGSGTTPGVGVPMVLVSGRLAAERALDAAGRARRRPRARGRPVTATDHGARGYRHPAPSAAIVAQAVAATGPVDLAGSYELCRRLNAAHGRTYYLATRFLPREQRRHVHALYAFARYADDLVDHGDLAWSPARRRAELEAWAATFLASLERGESDDPVRKAVIATVARARHRPRRPARVPRRRWRWTSR